MNELVKTPLVKKLGIKEDMRVKLINHPENYFDLLGEPFPEFEVEETDLDFVHVFTNTEIEFKTIFKAVANKMKPKGMIWVSWYKKTAGKPSELSGSFIRGFFRSRGWIDSKVCSVDNDWTALKFVVSSKSKK
jgi:hypothetical protein